MIDETTLIKFGAKMVAFPKNTILFREGEKSLFYWQIAKGVVKMVNYSDNGRSFVQGIFYPNDSFGEPPLFADLTYPSDAVSDVDVVVWKLAKTSFLELLQENFALHLKLTEALSRRLHYKATILKEIASQTPRHRIITLIDYLKKEAPSNVQEEYYEVPYTRKQLAEMTGLRVETVIRNIKSLEKTGALVIKNRKVYRKL